MAKWKIVITSVPAYKGSSHIALTSDAGSETITYCTSPEETRALCDGIGIALRAVGEEYTTYAEFTSTES